MIGFEEKGPINTEESCKIAIQKAIELSTDIVFPTTSGDSAVLLCQMAKIMGFNNRIVIVTHAYGFKEPGINSLTEENRKTIEEHGAKIVTATHSLSGVERAMSAKFGGVYPVEIIAHTLRMFSQGVKVVVEISSMALDAGAIEYGKQVVCLGGTSSGIDTVVVMTPAYGNNLFTTKINELLCMPKN